MNHELLDNLEEVLLGDHAAEEVERPQPYRLVRVVEALHDEVLVALHALRVRVQDLRHGEESKVLQVLVTINVLRKVSD